MAHTDAVNDYRAAVERLLLLTDEIGAQRSQDAVLDAVADLRGAVVRAYRGSRMRPGGGSAQSRILAYLTRRLGEWVGGDEIAAVSEISEWARRVRELRQEQGYQIEEEGGCYRLLAEAPDPVRRDRWQMVTTIRRRDADPVDRVKELLETFVGEVVTRDEIDRVAHGKQGATLIRQIRNQELLPIESYADAPDLGHGDHRLVSLHDRDRLHPSQVLFSEDLRRQVFSRDRFTCRICRLAHGSCGPTATGAFYLVVRHLDASADALQALPTDRLTNLARLASSCNRCTAGSVEG